MLLFGAVVLVVLVVSVVVFRLLAFLVLGGWGWGEGGACSFVFCYCFASCFSSVSMRSDYFIFYFCRDSSEDCGVRSQSRYKFIAVYILYLVCTQTPVLILVIGGYLV